ncbi:MAG: hypothetical protein R3C59_15880 [Planctomycetaceae bacterium]
MQVNKLHIQLHAAAGSQNQKLQHARGKDVDPGTANSASQRDLSSATEAVQTFWNALQYFPDVRADHVDAARVKLAQGDYTTPEAAVDTAAAILKQS